MSIWDTMFDEVLKVLEFHQRTLQPTPDRQNCVGCSKTSRVPVLRFSVQLSWWAGHSEPELRLILKVISLLVPLTKIWATANLTGNWNNNDQKESHRKKRSSLCEVFLFSCVFKQIFQARQWQFRSRWGKTGLDLPHNYSSLVLIGVSPSHVTTT